MSKTKDIKSFTRKIFAHSQKQVRPALIHPVREWVIMLVVFFVVFVAGVVNSVWQYNHYQSLSESVTASTDVVVPRYNESGVESVHALYRERDANFNLFLEQGQAVAQEEESVEILAPDTQAEEESVTTEEEEVVVDEDEETVPLGDPDTPASPQF